MRRKTIIALTVAALSLFVSACSSNAPEQNGTTSPQPTRSFSSELSRAIGTERDYSQGWLKKVIDQNQNVPFGDLKPLTYSRDLWIYFARHTVILGETDADNIQRIDDEHIALIERVTDDNLGEAGLAIVFRKEIYGEKEHWHMTRERYFFDPLGSYRHELFKDIKAGDVADDLCGIDPSIGYELLVPTFTLRDSTGSDDDRFYTVDTEDYVERNGVMILETDDETVAKYGAAVIRSINENTIYSILEDGILEISYKRVDKSITEINFYPYGDEKLPDNVTIRNADILDAVRRGE